MSKSKRYKLPKCPPPTTVLIDRNGQEWRVENEPLASHWLYPVGQTSAGNSWLAVLSCHGPLTVKPEPKPEPRTWSADFPEEPAVGTKVRDRHNHIWTHVHPDMLGWRCGTVWHFTWAHVLDYGPLTEVLD